MKKFLLSIFAVMLAVFSVKAQETATLSFADKAQRASFSTTSQVWEQNGITLTNNKSSSTSNIADYAAPARFYKSSEIIVECSLGNITSIEFDCNSTSYATALENSIGGTATVSSDKVTVALDGTSNSFTIASLSGGQVRMDALTVTYAKASTGTTKPVAPTLTAGGNFVGSTMVEISCATEDAEIYYTTDGTEPTEDSDMYSEAFEIAETTTVKAIAVNEAGSSTIATAVYTRVAATPEISFDEATFAESVEVTITSAEGTTAYYTLNGKTPTDESDECPETLTIKADATLQVIAYDEDGYVSPVVKQAFKKAASDAGAATGTATLVEDAADLAAGDQIVIVAAGSDYALSTTQNSNNRGQIAITKVDNNVELNDNVQVLTLENGTVDGTLAFNTGSGYLYAASSGSNYLKTQTTNNANGSWSVEIANGVATIKAQGSNTRNWMRYNSTSKLFSCYGSGQQDISIYKVNLATVEDFYLNVTEAGWATMYLGYDVVIPEGVTCYVISEVGAESVQLEKVTGILPANTGAIVEAAEGEYPFVITEGDKEIESIMLGTLKNEYITKEAYVLGIVEGEVGLYKAEMAGGVWLNNANKAYLPASVASGAASYSFRFEGATTAIENVVVENASNVIFDLTGRKVEAISAPGIYVVNGKKVLVK